MNRPLHLSLLVLLTACALQDKSPVEEPVPELTLSASVTEGVAPLDVTFSTQITPASATLTDTYTWTLAGQLLANTTSDLT